MKAPVQSLRFSNPKGFALVVTLTLMVLLTLLALGLLSLSSVSLRTMTRNDAEATARANALLALQLAIGDLQANLGPDQRISATSDVLGDAATVKQQKITGVWKSNKLGTGSTAADFAKAEKTKQFVKWLVSGSDQTLLATEDYANSLPGAGKDVVELVSSANLETGAPVISARKVALSDPANPANATGSYAYAVIDEGVKARINMGNRSPGSGFLDKIVKLGSGERPSLAGVPGIVEIPAEEVELTTEGGRARVAKMVSMQTSELSYKTGRGEFVRKSHDFTTHAAGVLANVADGGLKRDINLLAESLKDGTLPAQFASKGIYEAQLGASVSPDPRWSRALGWAGIFNTPAITEKTVTTAKNGVKEGGIAMATATATAPPGWKAGQGVIASNSSSGSASLSNIEPPGVVLMPSVAKIQLGFAITARDMYEYPPPKPNQPPVVPPDVFTSRDKDGNENGTPKLIHGPQGNWFRRDLNDKNPQGKPKLFNSPVDFMLHLIYTPIVTLHNPYNVPLDFTNLRVELVNVPFAIQVFRKRQTDGSFIAQTNHPVPFSIMGDAGQGTNKRFGLLITDTLLPGEVKTYTPNINPDKTWFAETTASGKKNKFDFVDYVDHSEEDGRIDLAGRKVDTSRANAIPGWNGQGVGYSIEGLCVHGKSLTSGSREPAFGTDAVLGTKLIQRGTNIPLMLDDELYTEVSPMPDLKLPEKKFSVEMTLDWAPGKRERSSAYVFEFSGYSDLERAMITSNPQAKSGNIRSPRGSDTWFVSQIHDHSSVALKNMSGVKPIGLFSAYAKTATSGQITSSTEGEDGLYPAKPFAFQNQSAIAINQNLATATPAHYSHELAISRFPEIGSGGIQLDTGRAKFLSGHSANNGRHFGTLLEVPLAPLQSLVTLNSANLAGGTALPHFFAPVGNSYVHPMMTGTTPVEAGREGYTYADHSFLLNSALFDAFYCSGLQTHAPTTIGGDGKSVAQLISGFVATADPTKLGGSPLPDSRLRAYLPDGETPAEAESALTSPGGYKAAASHQLVDGAFNVNSTSVAAWKAMLASMPGEGASIFTLPPTVSADTTPAKGTLVKNANTGGARFTRLRMPGGQADREDEDGFWRGPIDIDADQLDSLASEIVAQVKLRGPFLSVAEFVNRQLGSASSQELAFSGAIQAAIDATDINTGVSVAAEAGYEIDKSAASGLNFGTPTALAGESTQGAPGYLMQSDILAVLGNTVTVRSDTFTIRAYGEAVGKDGKITARSYCEAVVQRLPEYVDSLDTADTDVASLTSNANQLFGRRFEIVSFRWLSPSEI